ncbi:nucleotide cyclase [Polychytrium aggregatum]|uniref:nucleotide cyclase n=1 Tax=Polychytrium aggregatum TaxID=110093 RepID=UPI0022FE890E|nr:nucleotide cyclase [Polychytrium aggregatum]KAI9203358.1 nucleotide cyclase [Polychytrium aggregatum]
MAAHHSLSARKIIFQTTQPRSLSPSQPTSYARLMMNASYGGQVSFALNRRETKLGRKEDNHIVLTCAKISKYHAVIRRDDEDSPPTYYIKDNMSANGLRINDSTIEPGEFYRLADDDVIKLGTITLRLQYASIDDGTPTTSPSKRTPRPTSGNAEKFLRLVTILPFEQRYEDSVTIRAELEADGDPDFKRVDQVTDIGTLREDYEKLRLAYKLSQLSFKMDITELLARSLDLIFEILAVDRGVVLLVDQATGILSTQFVKLREGKADDSQEILMSSTIIRKVYYTRTCLITSDAYEDPLLGKTARYGQMRSVICVPLIARNKVHGILHLDSKDRINSFSSKDLSLVKTISNHTAMAIENSILIKEVEQKARITEQLSRFLAPHVVDRMVNRSDISRSGGRELVGTIVFVDIRGFTHLSETCEPSEVVSLLNDYFERLVRIVFKYEGVVDKYIGDALMAVFGTLEGEVDAEYRSVAAGIEFVKAIDVMSEERQRIGKAPISIGVGINTGEILAGFIGCSQRLEYTCIGDAVNTSSRICDSAKSGQVLISETTYEFVKDRIECRPIGSQHFKGKTREVMIYEAVRVLNE